MEKPVGLEKREELGREIAKILPEPILGGVIKAFDSGQFKTGGEVTIEVSKYRMISLSFSSLLPGYQRLDGKEKDRLVTRLLMGLLNLNGSRMNMMSNVVGEKYTAWDFSENRETVITVAHEFCAQVAAKIIAETLEITNPAVCDYVWMGIGQDIEQPLQFNFYPAGEDGTYHVGHTSPASPLVVAGALLAEGGKMIMDQREEEFAWVRDQLKSGEVLPVLISQDDGEVVIEFLGKKTEYPARVLPVSEKIAWIDKRQDRESSGEETPRRGADRKEVMALNEDQRNFLEKISFESYFSFGEILKMLDSDTAGLLLAHKMVRIKMGKMVSPVRIEMPGAGGTVFDLSGMSKMSKLAVQTKGEGWDPVAGMTACYKAWQGEVTEILGKEKGRVGINEYRGDAVRAVMAQGRFGSLAELEPFLLLAQSWQTVALRARDGKLGGDAQKVIALVEQTFREEPVFVKVAIDIKDCYLRLIPGGGVWVPELVVGEGEGEMEKLMDGAKKYLKRTTIARPEPVVAVGRGMVEYLNSTFRPEDLVKAKVKLFEVEEGWFLGRNKNDGQAE